MIWLKPKSRYCQTTKDVGRCTNPKTARNMQVKAVAANQLVGSGHQDAGRIDACKLLLRMKRLL